VTELLRLRDVRRQFGGVHAVDGVTLLVEEGSATALIGPNGAGKSTLLGIVGGAVRPSGGTIHFDDHDITKATAASVARYGLIRTFQSGGEFGRLTVLENLLVGRRAWRGQERDHVERARELLDRFDMSHMEDEYAANLSGGQKRLLEIMRALMARPRLLLLDEPMAGVNPSLGRRIETHLGELNREGLTMVMVEHELGVVERMCERVVVMALGKIISDGTMASVRKDREVIDAYLVG
jgi:ABC-type branched-subunit amino acid transport system ATPase component